MSYMLQLLFDPQRCPADKDFFKNIDYLRPLGYGFSTHRLLQQAFVILCPLTQADSVDSLAILDEDNIKVRPYHHII